MVCSILELIPSQPEQGGSALPEISVREWSLTRLSLAAAFLASARCSSALVAASSALALASSMPFSLGSGSGDWGAEEGEVGMSGCGCLHGASQVNGAAGPPADQVTQPWACPSAANSPSIAIARCWKALRLGSWYPGRNLWPALIQDSARDLAQQWSEWSGVPCWGGSGVVALVSSMLPLLRPCAAG